MTITYMILLCILGNSLCDHKLINCFIFIQLDVYEKSKSQLYIALMWPQMKSKVNLKHSKTLKQKSKPRLVIYLFEARENKREMISGQPKA